MMLGQPMGCENIRKPWIAWRSKTIVLASEPVDHRIGVARIKEIAHWRFQRLVMCREWAVVQTFGHVNPTEPVLMQHKRRVARDRVQPLFLSRRPITRSLSGREIGDVDSGPFALGLVPPHQFLSLAPGLACRAGARSIIYDAPIAGPGKAPPMSQIVFRLTRVRFVHAVAAKNARVNPTTAGG